MKIACALSCIRHCARRQLTPFFPGMAHSQFIKFMVPSGFLVGTATKPCVKKHKTSLIYFESVALNVGNKSQKSHVAAYKWVVFSPSFALLGQSAKSDTRHCCSSTPPCGKTANNRLFIASKLSRLVT